MPPTSRRPDRAQAAGPSNRSRMYNLAGHAHSSGSLLPRSTEVHAASTSTAAIPASPRGVDAAEAPYLSNLEAHFGRVTLVAPDNLLRKQAKEKKQKKRQRKAQNAQQAAAALAGVTQSASSSSAGRNAPATTSNLLDPSRRYQSTLEEAPVSTGLLLSTPGQHVGMRRAYSGGQTPTLSSISHLQTPPPSTSQTVVARTRRRRPSAAREDSGAAASRASGPNRPHSALSFNDNDSSQVDAPNPQRQQASGGRTPRSRTESAPASQPRSQNAFATGPDAVATDYSARSEIEPPRPSVPRTSLHRQNVWNDITEADPDDLPPPFPEGASRPRTPPLPPSHSEAGNDAQLFGPQPHVRIPSSPPPPFVSEDEDEPGPAESTSASRSPPRGMLNSPPTPPQQPASHSAAEAAGDDRPASRASASSSASFSDDESIELTEERRAWEADIQKGLSFEIRLLREQQRRVARERAMALRLSFTEQQNTTPGPNTGPTPAESLLQSHDQQPAAGSTVEHLGEAAAATEEISMTPQAESSEIRVSHDSEQAVPAEPAIPANDVLPAEQITDRQAMQIESVAEQRDQQPARDAQPVQAEANRQRLLSMADAEHGRNEASMPPPTVEAAEPEPRIAPSAADSIQPMPMRESEQVTNGEATATEEVAAVGRLVLANEPRLGLPPMPGTSVTSPRVASATTTNGTTAESPRTLGHRKTNSDTLEQGLHPATQSTSGNSQPHGRVRAQLGSLSRRRLDQGLANRRHDSDSHLPLSRRPEDTLYVISAPPPASYSKSTSEEEGTTATIDRATSSTSLRDNDAAGDASSEHGAAIDEDDGAESDSSIEQWLAEAAAFDALRKREEEAAARLQALREAPVSDSDEDDDHDATMPGAFTRRTPPHRRQASAVRKVPDPTSLALMDRALPKAPPPLVLGRSRGGAAYSDSSSDSTDTDDALDLYSSSEEDDEQHRAFHLASSGELQSAQQTSNDPFIRAHGSVHARNTSSAPNLTILPEPDFASSKQLGANDKVSMNDRRDESSPRNTAPPLPPRASPQVSHSNSPSNSLSKKDKGKQPEGKPRSPAPQRLGTRAGHFEEDSSSSRDFSDAEEASSSSTQAPSGRPTPAPLGDSLLSHRDGVNSLTKLELSHPGGNNPAQIGVRRSSLDPLLQPLSYRSHGRTDLGHRLKGLFGQPLVAGSGSQPASALQDNAPSVLAAQFRPATSDAQRPLSGSRSASIRSTKEDSAPAAADVQRSYKADQIEEPPSPAATSQQDTGVPSISRRSSTLRRQPSTHSQADAPQPSGAEVAKVAAVSSVLNEQKARDEALAQIAQLSSSTQSRQESLAALERLLAKTGRPTSMLAPGTMSRADLDGRTLPTPTAAAQTSRASTSTALDTRDPAISTPPATNRLSRQGAIIRGRAGAESQGSLTSPPSALSRAASATPRPVSFVNPRSSAAPLPRGRLPAITDATRHFQPSSSTSTGPGVAPSWLSYIPSDERERLPAPLEPHRVNPIPPTTSRAPGGRVSAMISRFEAPAVAFPDPRRSPSSHTKPGATSADFARRTESNRSNDLSTGEAVELVNEAEPAVFRRFSRTEGSNGALDERTIQRRPPPPPPLPSLPSRQPDANPFRRSGETVRITTATSRLTQSASVEALARQIEEAASMWSSASLQGSVEPPANLLAAPAATSDTLTSSPRTQAMETLTRREHASGARTPPPRPPKSSPVTPEQILAGGSRSGLSASIAAAQAAAFARRDGRDSRTHSASSSVDVQQKYGPAPNRLVRGGPEEGPDGVSSCFSGPGSRPLPMLPQSVRSIRGLGFEGDGEQMPRRELPAPPPLPTRPPRDHGWSDLNAERSNSARQETTVPPPNIPQQPSTPSAATPPSCSAPTSSVSLQNMHIDRVSAPTRANATVTPPAATASSTDDSALNAHPPTPPAETPLEPSTSIEPTRHPPRREPSLGLTDFDLLVAHLEREGSHFESLSAIGEFLGPAKPTAATPEQLAALSVGLIECDSRRVTREGKIKQKLSCVGVRVDNCTICMAQFREGQRAVILPHCSHIFHEECATQLLKRVTTCPTCRASAV